MNPITDIIFSLTWVVLFVFAIRSIARGWSIAREDTARPNGMWTTKVTKVQHPEMVDVKPGEELMGVTFEERPTSCDLEEYQALQERIEELKLQLDPDEDDDEDDDDGDIVVRL
tara:strand:+ start:1099 stop:1440 length:342 start_codon:yes stop_codon:yes gene_type:complete